MSGAKLVRGRTLTIMVARFNDRRKPYDLLPPKHHLPKATRSVSEATPQLNHQQLTQIVLNQRPPATPTALLRVVSPGDLAPKFSHLRCHRLGLLPSVGELITVGARHRVLRGA
jgi:hypothetical protein